MAVKIKLKRMGKMRNAQYRIVVEFAHDDRDGVQADALSGAPAPLAGNDFIAFGTRGVVHGTNQNRLHDPLSFDRSGQFAQRCLVHPGARLVFTGLQRTHGKCFLALRFGRHIGREKGVEPAATEPKAKAPKAEKAAALEIAKEVARHVTGVLDA